MVLPAISIVAPAETQRSAVVTIATEDAPFLFILPTSLKRSGVIASTPFDILSVVQSIGCSVNLIALFDSTDC